MDVNKGRFVKLFQVVTTSKKVHRLLDFVAVLKTSHNGTKIFTRLDELDKHGDMQKGDSRSLALQEVNSSTTDTVLPQKGRFHRR